MINEITKLLGAELAGDGVADAAADGVDFFRPQPGEDGVEGGVTVQGRPS